MELADLGKHLDLDLWNFHTNDGRSIQRALDFLLPYATGSKKWEHQQISELKPQELVPLLLKAAIRLRNPDYVQAAEKIGIPNHDVNAILLQAKLHAQGTKATKAGAGAAAKK